MLEQHVSLSASFFPKQNETLQMRRQHRERFQLNQKGTQCKPDRKTTSVLWVKRMGTLDIGIFAWYLVCGMGFFSSVCLRHCKRQPKQTHWAVIRKGQSQWINTTPLTTNTHGDTPKYASAYTNTCKPTLELAH